jgi:hypothetical protein
MYSGLYGFTLGLMGCRFFRLRWRVFGLLG